MKINSQQDINLSSTQTFRYSWAYFIGSFIPFIIVGAAVAIVFIKPSMWRGHPMTFGQVIMDPSCWVTVLIFVAASYFFLQNLLFEIKILPEGILIKKNRQQQKLYWHEISKLEMTRIHTRRVVAYNSYSVYTVSGIRFPVFDSHIGQVETLLSIFKMHGFDVEPFDAQRDIQQKYHQKLEKLGTTQEAVMTKPFWQLPIQLWLPYFIFVAIFAAFLWFCWKLIF